NSVALLEEDLKPVLAELNTLDWKRGLSPNNERVVEHLCAMANHACGGFLVFGIDSATAQPVGVTPDATQAILSRLTNLGRNGVEPLIALDHAVVDCETQPLLVVHIPEQASK